MPICNWCGIDSKNEVTCDWCKRPIALQPQRIDPYHSDRPGADAPVDETGQLRRFTPGQMLGGGLVAVAVVVALAVVFMSPSNSSTPTVGQAAPPIPLDTHLLATNTPITHSGGDGGGGGGGGIWASATPIFLPPPAPVVSSGGTPIPSSHADTPTGSRGPDFISEKSHMVKTLIADVGIAKAKLSMVKGGDKRSRAVGQIVLFNDTAIPINDYRVEFYSKGRVYPVAPFEGTIKDPQPIYSRYVRAHGELSTPIVIEGYNGARPKGTLRLIAYLDGESLPIADEIPVK